ncbi:hypothetical protein POM88_030691 [Heracleum sosnowskyi]|uniref:Uncharacterized protein n=1 Tax=Heracleum sosnowskyi TaxID=360622 RepID=A0AAD8HWX8_9APIA|nr:hypothetical protein POM88_030691 [Heracleum sosnowskyi]
MICNSIDAAQPGLAMKDQNGISGHLDGCGRTDPLSTELKDENSYLKTPEPELYVDDDSCINKKETKDSVAASGVHIELSNEDSTVYADKNILETDPTELIVYKDCSVHAVKDMCVDEGVHTESKCLAESVAGGHSTSPSNNYKHIDLAEEANNNIVYEDGFKSSSYTESRADAAADCASKIEVNLMEDNAYNSDAGGLESSLESGKHEAFASDHCPESKILTGEVKRNAIEKTTNSFCDSTLLFKDLRRKISLKCLLESSKSGENDSSQRFNEMSGVQGRVITEEPNKSSHMNNFHHSGELESRIITSSADSSKLAPSTKKDIHEFAIRQQLNPENELIHDDGISGRSLVINNQIKRGEGESSFSVAGPLSDVVPYSGNIPFSGSISLRSDSSTTSTRSFAFPVLPNEWNSSPVRMAKADRRHLRKHRGCNLGLFCCRF